MITYPDFLPLPKLSGKTQKQQNGLIQTTLQSGYARTRRPFVNTPTRMEFEVRCKNDKAQLFEAFVKYTLNGAVNPFLFNIQTPQGLVLHQVRFLSDPLDDATPINRLVWVYKAELEIANRAVLSEEAMVATLLAPQTLEQFVVGIEQALDSYQE